jgi:hypothetical protein
MKSKQIYKDTAATSSFYNRNKVRISGYQYDIIGYMIKTHPRNIQTDLYINPFLLQVRSKTILWMPAAEISVCIAERNFLRMKAPSIIITVSMLPPKKTTYSKGHCGINAGRV